MKCEAILPKSYFIKLNPIPIEITQDAQMTNPRHSRAEHDAIIDAKLFACLVSNDLWVAEHDIVAAIMYSAYFQNNT